MRAPLLLLICSPLLLVGPTGCSLEGELSCGEGSCISPGTDGGDPRDAQGSDSNVEVWDGAVPLPDLPRDVPEDVVETVDPNAYCPAGTWPRMARAEHDPSGGQGGATGDHELQISVEGLSSRVLVHVPSCPGAGDLYGLVVVLHDSDGNRDYLRYKWLRASSARGYVIAAPLAEPSFVGRRNWLENEEHHRAVLAETLRVVEAAYPIDRKDRILTGLGAGASFANAAATADDTHAFGHLLLVNGSVWDPGLEQQGVKSFLVLGVRESATLTRRPASETFRYLFVAELGPYYPGPSWPLLPGDPEVAEIDPTGAVDWFWP